MGRYYRDEPEDDVDYGIEDGEIRQSRDVIMHDAYPTEHSQTPAPKIKFRFEFKGKDKGKGNVKDNVNEKVKDEAEPVPENRFGKGLTNRWHFSLSPISALQSPYSRGSSPRWPQRYAHPRRRSYSPKRETSPYYRDRSSTSAESGHQRSIYPDYYKPPARYPDSYIGPGPTHELEDLMSEIGIDRRDNRERGGRDGGRRDGGGDRRSYHNNNHGNNNRKRNRDDDDDGGRNRPTNRRRYEEPVASRLRREIIKVGEESVRPKVDVVAGIGRDIANNFEDDQVTGPFLDITLQLVVEQPLKIPFVAAVVMYVNDLNPEATKEIISRAALNMNDALESGNWRSFKLLLRFFACMQGILEDDGVFQICNQLFDWVVDLQSASTEDALGLELTKIILLTIPYALASTASDAKEKLGDLLDKTEIVASEAANHPFADLVNPYPIEGPDKPFGYRNVTDLIQRQLRNEEKAGWPLRILPRVYKKLEKAAPVEGENDVAEITKHALPAITIPVPVDMASKPLYPETFFSVYEEQEVKITPELTDISCSLIRDIMLDTIGILEFNRVAAALYMTNMDEYFAPNTFASRGITIDQLKNYPPERSRWKSEDIMCDAVFSQLFLLPAPEHKIVYYHSLITEICKLHPGYIAPTLGRAIRWLFQHVDTMDMELAYRFTDWFAHHVSNFDFRWKWIEWIEYAEVTDLTPKKAFIISALDKEIRLSFAKRVKETITKEFYHLISEGKFKDIPEYKYNSADHPYSEEGRQIAKLLREKGEDEQIQACIDTIHEKAAGQVITDTLVPFADVYTTAMCYAGAKSISHLLGQIERCMKRLQEAGQQSAAARRQIVRSVAEYWKTHTGNAISIIDKLLNYTIVTPESVLLWALGPEDLGNGAVLAEGWRYELVSNTIRKVTTRVRQIVAAKVEAETKKEVPEENRQAIEDSLTAERAAMRQLFAIIEDSVAGVAAGAADGMIEADNMTEEEVAYVKYWGGRWARVFRRKLAVEEAAVGETSVEAQLVNAVEQATITAERERRDASIERRKAIKYDLEKERRAREEDVERMAKEDREAEKNGDADEEAANGEDADLDMDVIE